MTRRERERSFSASLNVGTSKHLFARGVASDSLRGGCAAPQRLQIPNPLPRSTKERLAPRSLRPGHVEVEVASRPSRQLSDSGKRSAGTQNRRCASHAALAFRG